MGQDQPFRWILLIGFLGFLPIGIYFRIKSLTDERLDRRQEGLFILITLRLAGLAGVTGLVAYFINPGWMEWATLKLPVWLRWVGTAMGLLAIFLTIWTFRTLGRNLTDTVVTRRGHSLVTTGPYHWVRHPFYVCGALLVIASSLVAQNALILGAGSFAVALLAVRTRKEETNLVACFGDDYREYARRTERFFPRLCRPSGR